MTRKTTVTGQMSRAAEDLLQRTQDSGKVAVIFPFRSNRYFQLSVAAPSGLLTSPTLLSHLTSTPAGRGGRL